MGIMIIAIIAAMQIGIMILILAVQLAIVLIRLLVLLIRVVADKIRYRSGRTITLRDGTEITYCG